MTESRGYAVIEGSPAQVYKELQRLGALYKNEIHEVLSVDEITLV
jgi:hypothetical protein